MIFNTNYISKSIYLIETISTKSKYKKKLYKKYYKKYIKDIILNKKKKC